MVDDGRYLAAKTVADVWICYPWEATYVVHLARPGLAVFCIANWGFFFLPSDIDEHDTLAASQPGY